LQLLLLGPELEDVVLPSEDAELDELLLSACAAAAATATATAVQYIRCFMPVSLAIARKRPGGRSRPVG
jgi:hypothetical protein